MRWLRRILIFFLAILTVLVLAVGALWWKPQILLNERTAKWGLTYLPPGTEIKWQGFSLHFSPLGWLGKRVALSLKDLCWKTDSIEGCAEGLRLDISFSLRGKFKLEAVDEIFADLSQVTIKSNAPKPPEAPLPDLRLPDLAAYFDIKIEQVRAVALHLRKLVIAGEAPLEANLHLVKADREFGLTAEAKQKQKLALSINAKLGLEKSQLQGKGRLRGQISGTKLDAPIELHWGEQLVLQSQPSTMLGEEFVRTDLKLVWSQADIKLDIGPASLRKLLPPRRIQLSRCSLSAKLDQSDGHPAENTLDCTLEVQSIQGTLFPPLPLTLQATLHLEPMAKDRFRAKWDLNQKSEADYFIDTILSTGEAELGTDYQIVGTPNLSFSLDAQVPNVERWRNALDHTPFALPAPLRQLNGPIHLTGKLTKAEKAELLVALELDSDLAGGQSSLVTRNAITVSLKNPWEKTRSLHVDAKAELTDIALIAPPLTITESPRFLPDKRFVQSRKDLAPPSKPSIPITWNAQFDTGKPIRISSNLLQQPMPVAVHLGLTNNSQPKGRVEILPMPIEVFRKKAQVESISAIFHGYSNMAELNGVLVHQNPEVTIRILILGSTERPIIEFMSDPPLSRPQIISVLLYNKSLNELSEEEAQSASSFGQATTDGALGLFTLFFLSSTPIEAIAYDPVTQTYTARMRIDQKTTLSVGSNFENDREVAIRRRLGGRWAIRTEVKEERDGPNVVLTLLEWFRRF